MFSGARVSVLQDEKRPGEDGGDGCTAMGMHEMPLRTAQMVKFMVYIFYHNKAI